LGERAAARPYAEPDDRVRRIAELSRRLLCDMARTGYGDSPDLGHLTPDCAERARLALRAVGEGESTLETDYGDAVYGSARLPEGAGPVWVELLVEDQSVLRSPSGCRMPLPRSRWRLELQLDERCTRITSLHVAAA